MPEYRCEHCRDRHNNPMIVPAIKRRGGMYCYLEHPVTEVKVETPEPAKLVEVEEQPKQKSFRGIQQKLF